MLEAVHASISSMVLMTEPFSVERFVGIIRCPATATRSGDSRQVQAPRGHGIEADGKFYCCANCARGAGEQGARDRI